MKTIKNWDQFNESSGDEPTISLDIKSQISKLKKGPKGGSIDLGKVSQVADSTIKNIKQTYKDAIINMVKDRYILILNESFAMDEFDEGVPVEITKKGEYEGYKGVIVSAYQGSFDVEMGDGGDKHTETFKAEDMSKNRRR